MLIHINGTVGKNQVLRRIMILKNTVKKARRDQRLTWFKKLFRLHIFPGEFDWTMGPDFIFDEVESDCDKRHHQNQVSHLQAQLVQIQANLKVAENSTVIEQSNNKTSQSMLKTAENRISNLTNRLAAAETETDETLKQNSQLKKDMKAMEVERKEEEKRKEKRLGRKRIHEVGPGAVKKTKAAYKKRFVEEVNKYGETRGLVLDKMILRDENGEIMVVNSVRPNTFENLTPAERRRVERASFLKDANRISDRVYAAAVKESSLPPSSHVKQHEKELNKEVGEIYQVHAVGSGSLIYSIYSLINIYVGFV